VKGEVIDVTPSHLWGPRDEDEGRNLFVPRIDEISWWLKNEPLPVDGFVIIDDNDPQIGIDFDRMRPDLVPHMALTETKVGLTRKIAEDAIFILDTIQSI
jgi:hypothetical protein